MGWELPAVAGLSLLGGLFGGEGQELSSFEGHDELDPTKMATDLRRGMGDYLTLALDEARKPVEIGTTVAPLPAFTGGGLPMTIAAPAVDPARWTPSRRTLAPGLNIPDEFAGELRDTATFRDDPDAPGPAPAPGHGGGQPPGADKKRLPPVDFDGSPAPDDIPFTLGFPDDVNRTRGVGYQAEDMDQAVGAIELLMQQLRYA